MRSASTSGICPSRAVLHLAVSQADLRILGFQIMEPFATYTHAFDHVGTLGTYVDLQHRRQGIATRLFEATFAAALGRGYEKIFTFVAPTTRAALQAYLPSGLPGGRDRPPTRQD